MKKWLFLLAALAATLSCSNESEFIDEGAIDAETDAVAMRSISIVVNANDDDEFDTRVDFTDDAEGGYTVTWNAADELGAWFSTASKVAKLTIDSEKSSDYSTSFVGEISADVEDTTTYLTHPYVEVVTDDKISIDLSAQTASADLSSLRETTYMVSGVVDLTSETIEATMKHVGAIMDVNIKCEAAAGYTLTNVVVSCDKMPSGATVDITEDADNCIVSSSSDNTIAISVPSFEADASTGIFPTIAINTLPFTVYTGDSLTITATFDAGSGVLYRGTATLETTSEIEFGRAQRHSLYATITDDLLDVWTITSSAFTGSYSDGAQTVNGIGIDTYGVRLNSSLISMRASSSFMYNTSEMDDISEIVVTEGSTGSWSATIYASTSAFSRNSDDSTILAKPDDAIEITPVEGYAMVDGVKQKTYTYSVPATTTDDSSSTYSYFAIENGSTLSYASSIAVAYKSQSSTDELFIVSYGWDEFCAAYGGVTSSTDIKDNTALDFDSDFSITFANADGDPARLYSTSSYGDRVLIYGGTTMTFSSYNNKYLMKKIVLENTVTGSPNLNRLELVADEKGSTENATSTSDYFTWYYEEGCTSVAFENTNATYNNNASFEKVYIYYIDNPSYSEEETTEDDTATE